MSNRKELGKGIRALLNQMDEKKDKVAPKEIVEELTHTILDIPVDQIEVNPYQPRQEFDKNQLEDLAKSISVHGLIQPVTVRRLSDREYQLISGERRWRASKLAGLKAIPAYIRLADDQGLLEMALIENIQRSDLNAIEIAISYQRLMDECQLTHEDLSGRVGKDRSTVTNYLRLLKLPASVQQSVKDQQISMGHARVIAGISDPVVQLQVLGEVLQKGLSVRATEDLVSQKYTKRKKKDVSTTTRDSRITSIERNLSDIFGSRVKIARDQKGKGKIVISFSSDDEFNDILDRIDQ